MPGLVWGMGLERPVMKNFETDSRKMCRLSVVLWHGFTRRSLIRDDDPPDVRTERTPSGWPRDLSD